MDRIGLAVIGCGGISRVHLEAISRERRARLIATVDSDGERAETAARKYGASKSLTSWEPVLEDDDVDAAVICLPHDLHAPAAIAFLEKGKHVLVEKPIAIHVADADRIIKTAGDGKRVLMVGHMKRFNRAFVTMKRCIEAGNIGEPISFQVLWYGPREIIPSIPWVMKRERGGGGPLMGFGTHHIDLLHWLLGGIDQVACFTRPAHHEGSEVEDTSTACLRMINGAIGAVHYTWARAVDRFHEEITVLGRSGEVTVRGGNEAFLASEERFGDREIHPLKLDREAGDVLENEFSGELSHFIGCINSGEKPLTDGRGARDALSVIHAAYESAGGGGVVKVKY